MQIHGLNKTTLLDYPEHVACTVFTGGCNFRCPFCHNGELVLDPASQPVISEESFFALLDKRKGILEGVCITGGEPLLQKDLPQFIRRIKEKGLLVKLDTNGYRPELLKALLEEGLLDYVAMDIKSSPAGYPAATGLSNLDMDRIRESIRLLIQGDIPYEFRTTVVKGLHTAEDFIAIGELIRGAKTLFLQSYTEKDTILCALTDKPCPPMESFTPGELAQFADILKKAGIEGILRGV